MVLKEGEVYKCPNPNCGCEIRVTKAPGHGKGGDVPPRCCCGKEMVRK